MQCLNNEIQYHVAIKRIRYIFTEMERYLRHIDIWIKQGAEQYVCGAYSCIKRREKAYTCKLIVLSVCICIEYETKIDK